jgi:carbonyl reductase 1
MSKEKRRVAVVTGGNRGIGLEVGRQLARRGLSVVLGSRIEAEGQAAVIMLAREGLEVVTHRLDVTDPVGIAAFTKRLADTFGVFDILVNNAGIALNGFDAEVARQTIDVNFFGPLRVTDRLLPLMRPGGRIVMVSSGLGHSGDLPAPLRARLKSPDLPRSELISLMQGFVDAVAAGKHTAEGWPSSAYRVSKMGLNALTRVFARELAEDPRRILVNAGCPGWVRTAMGGKTAPRTVEQGAETPVWLSLLPAGGPQGGVFEEEKPLEW